MLVGWLEFNSAFQHNLGHIVPLRSQCPVKVTTLACIPLYKLHRRRKCNKSNARRPVFWQLVHLCSI